MIMLASILYFVMSLGGGGNQPHINFYLCFYLFIYFCIHLLQNFDFYISSLDDALLLYLKAS